MNPLVHAKIWKIDEILKFIETDPVVGDPNSCDGRLAFHRWSSSRRHSERPSDACVDRVGHDVQDGAVNSLRIEHDPGHILAGGPWQVDSPALSARLHQPDHVATVVQVRRALGRVQPDDREHQDGTLQYIVTNGSTFADLQQRDMTYSVSSPDPSGMVCQVTSTDTRHSFQLVTDYITDPARDSVVMRTRLLPLHGNW